VNVGISLLCERDAMKRGKNFEICISFLIIVLLIPGVAANGSFQSLNALEEIPGKDSPVIGSDRFSTPDPYNPNPLLTQAPAPEPGPDEMACSCRKRLPSETSGCGSDPASCVCKKSSSSGLVASGAQGPLEITEIVADCSQSNALDTGGCCCWVPDPTYAHNYGHVMDLGVIVKNPLISFDIQPGCGDCGCITNGYYYYSEDGSNWKIFWSEGNLHGWQLYTRSAVIVGNVRYLRANTDGCSVDFAQVKVTISDVDLSLNEFSAIAQSDVIDGI
jgi:hypothetical protein